jgi:hypothetical protein
MFRANRHVNNHQSTVPVSIPHSPAVHVTDRIEEILSTGESCYHYDEREYFKLAYGLN